MVSIDGSQVKSLDVFHDLLATALKFPSYYGRNLDALWDMLTGYIKEPVAIEINHAKVMEEMLGQDYFKLIRVLEEAPTITLRLL